MRFHFTPSGLGIWCINYANYLRIRTRKKHDRGNYDKALIAIKLHIGLCSTIGVSVFILHWHYEYILNRTLSPQFWSLSNNKYVNVINNYNYLLCFKVDIILNKQIYVRINEWCTLSLYINVKLCPERLDILRIEW